MKYIVFIISLISCTTAVFANTKPANKILNQNQSNELYQYNLLEKEYISLPNSKNSGTVNTTTYYQEKRELSYHHQPNVEPKKNENTKLENSEELLSKPTSNEELLSKPTSNIAPTDQNSIRKGFLADVSPFEPIPFIYKEPERPKIIIHNNHYRYK